MRRLIGGLALAILLAAAGGCTTRTDKDKNKDYDKPQGSAKG